MYTRKERVALYPDLVEPDFTGRTKAARLARKLLTACLGREFVELSAKQKTVGLYFIVSLMAPIVLFNENHPWLMLLLVGNLVNAGRLANRLIRKTSVKY